eukprot:TRINITY_DN1175_c2_g1_i1.p1 TRINITY_DN1175_c2_g1~~TRINITY_DN1175_c2_g1_i1.p1  ORF type:complete len:428 (-),score=179.62 TRINITY_DN1175_c2_g1_i1:156-1439(-)
MATNAMLNVGNNDSNLKNSRSTEPLSRDSFPIYTPLNRTKTWHKFVKKEISVSSDAPLIVSCAEEFYEDSIVPRKIRNLVRSSGVPLEKFQESFYICVDILCLASKRKIKTRATPTEAQPSETASRLKSTRLKYAAIAEKGLDFSNVKKLYKHIDKAGKGGFGRVFSARCVEDKKIVAIKTMSYGSNSERESILVEIGLMMSVAHPNIVEFKSAHQVENNEFWVVMEFLECGTLSDIIGVSRLKETVMCYICREIATSLAYLHSLNIVHRDIKSANIMIAPKGRIKLVDFGMCEDVSNSTATKICGSMLWMAPEMITSQPYGTSVDIWSFGICIIEMGNVEPPHASNPFKALFLCATGQVPFFSDPQNFSDGAKDFLSCCLVSDPEERYTAEQLLQHPWIAHIENVDDTRSNLHMLFVQSSIEQQGF